MIEEIHILGTGEFSTGDWQLQFLSPNAKNFPVLSGYNLPANETYRLAVDHGAVLFEIDANYQDGCHEEDELTEDFGQPMTYKEYWDLYPGSKIERLEPQWRTGILLHVSTAFVRLLSPTQDRLLIAQHSYAEDHFFLGLVPVTQPAADDDQSIIYLNNHTPLVFQPGFIRPLWAADQQASGHPPLAWQLGDEITLQTPQFPNPPLALRDWDWAWRAHTTYGPVYLWIYLDKTADELNGWFANLTLQNYRSVHDLSFCCDGELSNNYRKIGDYGYEFNSVYGSTQYLIFGTGQISWSRSYHTPQEDQQAIDASILSSILAGDLGEVEWDLFDGDYASYQAHGYGLASLREYLDPNCNQTQLRDRWNTLYHSVDATTVQTWQQVAEKIALHFQVPLSQADMGACLEQWLQTTPLAELPRFVRIVLSREFKDLLNDDHLNNLLAQLKKAQPRIRWSRELPWPIHEEQMPENK